MHWKLAAIRLLFSLAILAPARADRKTVIRDASAGHAVVTTNYVQGNNWRWESEVPLPSNAQRLIANIANGDQHSYYALDLRAKKYIEPQRVEPILTLAMWLRRAPGVAQSGKTVHTYFETIETGESRLMFGHMARHVITRERTVAEPGACSGNSIIERDGWYLPRAERTVRYQLRRGGGRECRDTIVAHGTRAELGFALQEKETNTPPVPTGYSTRSYTTTREVLELSDQPLDKSIFEPPKDFARVDVFPGDEPVNCRQRLEWNWRELERSFESWFE
ncbi:MAG: hypothetical protein ACR2NN_22045 [Bryobacteraceae bacterium]